MGGKLYCIYAVEEELICQVYVIDDRSTKNAFVLPGGKIFVFTGILPVSANDDGLATVLGHEIAHQGERFSFAELTISCATPRGAYELCQGSLHKRAVQA